MISPFSLQGTITRLPYALWSLGAFFSQHVLVLLLSAAQGKPAPTDWLFLLTPYRALVADPAMNVAALLFALAYFLIVAWMLTALTYRRAADADISEWIATAAIVPIVQIAVIAMLCAFPTRAAPEGARATDRAEWRPSDWAGAVRAVLAGIALTLFAVATSTLIFGSYGFGVFLLAPFFIGAITAYLANRPSDIGGSSTARLVVVATALGGFALVLTALEGLVCIVMASPLAFGAALLGGMMGRSIAVSSNRPPTQTMTAFVLLPLVFALENVQRTETTFDTVQTIEVKAPPEIVWAAILNMEPLEAPRETPFLLGVAYPISGEVLGEGIGATRRGVFSTGTAIERVTEWIPNRKLAFVVVSDVPALRELSPYEHVHAPHAVGYFTTASTSFELLLRPDGTTGIVERTSHKLKLEPILYWLPIARWIVHVNNARVLDHVRRQAERRSRAGG